MISVRDLVKERARDRSTPGQRRDAYRLALCIEGGAMRGVVSAGMVSGLEALGLLDVFDRVYGSSAGAINGAFFVAGQAAFGTTIYYENINNRTFIDLGRAWGARPILNLEFLLWDVMCGPKRLDVDRVMHSPVELRTLATSTASGERVTFGSWNDRDDFLACLRAGASMPIVAGPPYRYRDATYWDALLSEPIPAVSAEADGFTHLLVLLTRSRGASGPKVSWFDRAYVLPRVKRVSPPLAARYMVRPEEYRRILERLEAGHGPAGRASVMTIAPSGQAVGRLERNRTRLMAAARAGSDAVLSALGGTV